jgi:serpin B
MVYLGSKGATAQEIQKTTTWLSPDETASRFLGVNQYLDGLATTGLLQLQNANSLWFQKNFALEPDYRIQLVNFNAETYAVDFQLKTEPTRIQVNQWIDKQTNSKIKDLLAPGSLTSNTKLVICNAIYFKADWTSPFKPENSVPQPFYVGQETVQATTMHQMSSFQYAEDAAMQYLELPYKGQETSMIICLPKQKNGLNTWLNHISAAELTGIPGKFDQTYKRVNVALPKFKIETTHGHLVEQLKSLGITALFSSKANLDGIAKGQGLYVSSIIQKAMVAVDEKGTEATAATAMMLAGCAFNPDRPVEFTADHPFLFLITTKPAKAKQPVILFAGTVINPTSK